ncbi:KH domain-containing protein [Dictyocoela muelleri]|nr:KH domain-containing protein [Dictyocoela muelleri]
MTHEIEYVLDTDENKTMTCFGIILSLNEEDESMKQAVKDQFMNDLNDQIDKLINTKLDKKRESDIIDSNYSKVVGNSKTEFINDLNKKDKKEPKIKLKDVEYNECLNYKIESSIENKIIFDNNQSKFNKQIGDDKFDNDKFDNDKFDNDKFDNDKFDNDKFNFESFSEDLNNWISKNTNKKISENKHYENLANQVNQVKKENKKPEIKNSKNKNPKIKKPEINYIAKNKILISNPSIINIFSILRNIWRYNNTIEIPPCLYVLKDHLTEQLYEISKETNTLIRLKITQKILIIINGKSEDLSLAVCKIYKLIDKIMNKNGTITYGFFSLKNSLLKNKRLYFCSKINDKHAYLSEMDLLNEFSDYIIKIINIDIYKYNYLMFYKKSKIENLLCENDCYFETLSFESKLVKIKISGCKFKINNFYKKFENLCIHLYKIIIDAGNDFNNILIRLADINPILYFCYHQNEHFRKEYDSDDVDNKNYQNKSDNEVNKDNHKKDNNKFINDVKFIKDKRDNNKFINDDSTEIKLFIIGEKEVIIKILNIKICECRLFIELNKEIEDFICGKRSGKIEKIINDCDCKVLVDTELILEKKMLNILGLSVNVLKAFNLLLDEYPSEIAFYLDEQYHRVIIGYGGRNIQRMMKKHGVYIKFMNEEEIIDNGYDGNVIIKAPYKNNNGLKSMKNDIIQFLEIGPFGKDPYKKYSFYDSEKNSFYNSEKYSFYNSEKYSFYNSFSKVSLNDFYNFIDYYKNHEFKFRLNHVKINCPQKKLYYYHEKTEIEGDFIKLINNSVFIKTADYFPNSVIDYTYWVKTPYFKIFNSQLYFSYVSRIDNLISHDVECIDNFPKDFIQRLECVIIQENEKNKNNNKSKVNEKSLNMDFKDDNKNNDIKKDVKKDINKIDNKNNDIKKVDKKDNKKDDKKGIMIDSNECKNIVTNKEGKNKSRQRARNKRSKNKFNRNKNNLKEKVDIETDKVDKVISKCDDFKPSDKDNKHVK